MGRVLTDAVRRNGIRFAIAYGYQRFNWTVTWVAVLTIVLLVQLAQFLGNRLAGRALRR